jgi:pilus assembly protein CpaF
MDLVADDESSEVLANGPAHVSRKSRGARIRTDINFGSVDAYHQFLNEGLLPWTDTADRIDGRTVVIEGQLQLSSAGRPPMLARVHIVAPPGVPHAQVTIAKKPRIELTLDDLAANGTMTPSQAAFLAAAARARRTIVVSGPTGSGKTTFLQALTHAFNPQDRVVVVEETPELLLPLDDVVYLRATLERPGLDASQVFDMGFWTKQANRMRMDRIIIGETRGAEMADWLIAANSGAEGSATTVHANTPRRALDKVLALAMKAETAPSENHLRREIAVTVDLIVQIGLIGGRHVITEIEEISDTVSTQTGQIQTSTIFAFDATAGRHTCRNRPTDAFLADCAAHGVPLDLRWFQQP